MFDHSQTNIFLSNRNLKKNVVYLTHQSQSHMLDNVRESNVSYS